MSRTIVAAPAVLLVAWSSRTAVSEMPSACFFELCSKCVASPENYEEVFEVVEAVNDKNGCLKLLKLHLPSAKVEHFVEAAGSCTMRPDVFLALQDLGPLSNHSSFNWQPDCIHAKGRAMALGRLIDLMLVEVPQACSQDLRTRAVGAVEHWAREQCSTSCPQSNAAEEHVRQLASAHADSQLVLLVVGPMLQCTLCARLPVKRMAAPIQDAHKSGQQGPTSMKPQLAQLTCSLAGVQRGQVVLDPCCGSGALVDMARHFDAAVILASDINTPNSSLGEVLVMDLFQPSWHLHAKVGAILCDLPYGCREVIWSSRKPGDHQQESSSQIPDVNLRGILSALLSLSNKLLMPGCRAAVWLPHTTPHQQPPGASSSSSSSSSVNGFLTQQWLSDLPHWLHGEVETHELVVLAYLPESRPSGIRRAVLVVMKPGSPSAPGCRQSRSSTCTQTASSAQKTLPDVMPSPADDAIRLHRAMRYGLSRAELQGDQADVWRASWLGDIPAIRSYLAAGGNPNAVDTHHHNQTPLHCAAGYGREAAVQLLLQSGADPNLPGGKQWRTPLHSAIAFNHLEVAKLLLEAGADLHLPDVNGRNPLHEAAQRGHEAAVQLLLDAWEIRGKDEQGSGSKDVVDYINQASGGGGCTPLHEAARYGREGVIKVLLGCPRLLLDAVCSGEGLTAAHLAARWGHSSVLQLLHDAGAAMDLAAAGTGRRPVDEARAWSRPSCIEVLANMT